MKNKRFQGLQAFLDRLAIPIARWNTEHAGKVLLILILLVIVALFFASRVHMDTSYDQYFDPKDPAFTHYKNYQKEFNSDEIIYLVYQGDDNKEGVFDPVLMRKVEDLTIAVEREVPFVRKVTSLSNVEVIEAAGDDILIHRLRDKGSFTSDDLQNLRRITTTNPLYAGKLVTKDGRYGAIIVKMTLASTDPIEKLRLDPNGGDGMTNLYPQAPNNKVKEILARPEFAKMGILMTGDVPWNATYNEVIDTDMGVVTVACFIIVAILCMLLFRARWLGLFAPIGIVLLGILVTIGFMGMMGYQMNIFSMMVPTLICTVGVAQAIHLLMNWQNEYAKSGNPKEAARIAMEKIATPSLLCALTTAAGVIGMATANLKSMREFGIYAAVGILLTFAITMMLVTSLAARARKHPSDAAAAHPLWLEKMIFFFMESALKRPVHTFVIFVLLTGVACFGMFKLQVNYHLLEEFKSNVQWKIDTEKIEKIMGGTMSVVYVFDSGKADGIQEPELIKEIEGLQRYAEKQPIVADTTSIVDYLKDLNQAFHKGDPAYRIIPQERNALAQLLLVYELSGGKEMDDIRNIDRSKTVLEMRIKLVSASEMRNVVKKIDDYIAAHPISGAKVELSGIGLLWIKIMDYIGNSQIRGASTSFLIILGFIVIAFGSLKLGLWAMVPNILPFVFVLGFMGYMNWHLDYMRVMLASVTMGIAIDDTIHFLARLRAIFKEKGNYQESLRETMHEVGIPITITSFVLFIAFGSYLFSQMAIFASFGILLGISIVVGWVLEIFLTPTLMILFKPFGPEFTPTADTAEKVAGAMGKR